MKPFSDGDTNSTFRNHINKIIAEIDNLDNEYILKASKTELEEYYLNRAYIEEIELDVENKYLTNRQAIKIDARDMFNKNQTFQVQGTQIDLCIPFEGDMNLFNLRASRYSLSGYPEISVTENLLVIKINYKDSNANGEQIRKKMESDLKSICDAIANINNDVKTYNHSVKNTVETSIKNKIEKSRKALDVISFLDVPFIRKDCPETYVVNVDRKIKISSVNAKPKVSNERYHPEPILDNEEYEHILTVMRSMSKVIERSPDSFIDLDEESIRMHFLIQLNGHYEGKASGETFNKSGKTDILIREGDRNIFIGECKFWKGQKSFDAAIDQLLGYLTWRDSKCALLIFNKNKNSTEVIKKMHEIMLARNECKKVIKYNNEYESKYIFVKDTDPGREIIITTQLFDIPVE